MQVMVFGKQFLTTIHLHNGLLMRNVFIQLVSALFILLFVYAAVSKLIGFEVFAAQLKRSPILTHQAAFFSVAVPATEFLISFMLILPHWQLLGLYASFGMMVLFTAYIIAITRFSDDVPCSCGGVLQNMTWDEHLVFNVAFLILSVMAILLYRRSYGLGRVSRG
jgi:hypothetical protein